MLASQECTANVFQGMSLMAEGKDDLEKIQQMKLSCPSVIDNTFESQSFQVLTHMGKYNVGDFWNQDLP
jgi:hypothetical protein